MNLCHHRRTDDRYSDRYSYLTQSQSTIMEMMGSYRLWSQADQQKKKWARPDCIFMVELSHVCIGIVLHYRTWRIMFVDSPVFFKFLIT